MIDTEESLIEQLNVAVADLTVAVLKDDKVATKKEAKLVLKLALILLKSTED